MSARDWCALFSIALFVSAFMTWAPVFADFLG